MCEEVLVALAVTPILAAMLAWPVQRTDADAGASAGASAGAGAGASIGCTREKRVVLRIAPTGRPLDECRHKAGRHAASALNGGQVL